MPISPQDFLRKYGFDDEQEDRDHSLRRNALDHARHLRRPHAGTPHDWEEWERFRREHPDQVDGEDTDGR